MSIREDRDTLLFASTRARKAGPRGAERLRAPPYRPTHADLDDERRVEGTVGMQPARLGPNLARVSGPRARLRALRASKRPPLVHRLYQDGRLHAFMVDETNRAYAEGPFFIVGGTASRSCLPAVDASSGASR